MFIKNVTGNSFMLLLLKKLQRNGHGDDRVGSNYNTHILLVMNHNKVHKICTK